MPCCWSALWPGRATQHAAAAARKRRAPPHAATAAMRNWKPSLAAISERTVLPRQPPQEAADKRRGGVKKRRIRSATSHTDPDNFRHYGVLPIPPMVPSFPCTVFLF